MSRHTLSDGITPDLDITPDSYDEWWPQLAPPLKLIGDYYKRGLSWEEFQTQYVSFLKQEVTAVKTRGDLIWLAMHQNVTILCVEDTPEKCHRRLIAEECQRLCPDLKLSIA